jgi:hypothetical protein
MAWLVGPPDHHVTANATCPLTSVPAPVTYPPNSLTEGACRPACRQVERGAVPAGGIANPHSGGSGAAVDRHKDRSARSALNRRLECKQAKHLRA